MGAASGTVTRDFPADQGGASRFFYTAKASKQDRGHDNTHPTVKPQSLINYLLKLIRPPKGGVVLDPYMGSGTTALAAKKLGIDFVGCELDPANIAIANKRLRANVGLLMHMEATCL